MGARAVPVNCLLKAEEIIIFSATREEWSA